MRVALVKKLGIALLVAGLLSAFAGFLGVGYAGADASWDPADNALINPGNVPASNTGNSSDDDCGSSAAGDWGWYFVLPPGTANGANEFISIDVQFSGAGLIQHAAFIHPNGTLNKAVVFTASSDTLVDARAVVSPTPDPAPAQFVLSHVCSGTTESTSSSSSSVESSSSENSSSSESSSSESSSSSVESSSSENSSSSSESSSSESSSSSVESSSSENSSSSSVESSSSAQSSSSDTSVLSSSEESSTANTAATVLGSETERAAALPRTGVDPTLLVTIGLLMSLAGGALALSSDRLIARRRS